MAIIDVTGVPHIDTSSVNALLQVARAVRLLGAQVVLTGIRPEVAQAIVGLDLVLAGIVTRRDLQSGIAFATTSRLPGSSP
ncbi:STAS domain-containing protein [Sorangium sp. So ce1151]|uniref:STAS domain-containing protein n=1 Tax=Sorangium sp. So ce1151 TaxID=3133332 RepID=UPI003F5E0500